MKIVFMGTPDFSVPALEALIKRGHDVKAVVTKPDAKRNRGKKISFTPVKGKAIEYGIPVLQPKKLSANDEIIEELTKTAPDMIVVVAYGQILPKEILDIPPEGCINIHGSLLPRHRGAAPIQKAVLDGDIVTGVTIMYMGEGIDTGDMLAKAETTIDHKTAGQLHDEIARMGAQLLCDTIENMKKGKIVPEKQDEVLATYAHMIYKKDGKINFDDDPEKLERQIRAMEPWPGTFAEYKGKTMKIWQAEVPDEISSATPGTILDASAEGIRIAAGGKVLLAKVIQMPGKRKMPVSDFLKGNCIKSGVILK